MPGSFIPPPYEELGLDGERYFKILGTPDALVTTYEYLLEAAELAARLPITQAVGIQIDLLIRQLQGEVNEVARLTAIESMSLIRRAIEDTRVRPKGDGRLSAAILSKPVQGPIPGGGSVGIGAIDALNVGTLRPSGASVVPFYWRAQEFGSDHLVGRQIVGVYQPGESAPSAARSRNHPFFETRGRGQGPRYKMVISRPIEERGFLRSGAMEAAEFRRAQFRTVENRALESMGRILTGAK